MVKAMRLAIRAAAAILTLSIAASTACLARADAGSDDETTDYSRFWSHFWEDKDGAIFAKYYGMHARISAVSERWATAAIPAREHDH